MPVEIDEVRYLVVHCSATDEDQDITEEDVRSWHQGRGWSDIGYHVFIRRNGMIEYGRPFDERGAHVRGFNSESIGICMAGGVDRHNHPQDNFTPAQWDSLRKVMQALYILFPQAVARGHRDFPNVNKACPSFDVSTIMARWGM